MQPSEEVPQLFVPLTVSAQHEAEVLAGQIRLYGRG